MLWLIEDVIAISAIGMIVLCVLEDKHRDLDQRVDRDLPAAHPSPDA